MIPSIQVTVLVLTSTIRTRRLDDDLGFSVVENIQDVPLHQSLLVPHVESVHVSLSHLLFIIYIMSRESE